MTQLLQQMFPLSNTKHLLCENRAFEYCSLSFNGCRLLANFRIFPDNLSVSMSGLGEP